MMRIRDKATGVVAQTSDDNAAALIRSGAWEPVEPEVKKAPARRTRRTKAKTSSE